MTLVFKVESILPLTVETEKIILEGGSYGYAFLNLPLGHGLSVGQEVTLSARVTMPSVGDTVETDLVGFLKPYRRSIRLDMFPDAIGE